MNNERWTWVRDWALIGGLVSASIPGVFGVMTSQEWLVLYALHAAMVGIVTGGGVGAAFHALLCRFPKWSWPAISLFVVWPCLGAWGGIVGASTAMVFADVPYPLQDSGPVLGLLFGSVSAMLQCGWTAPLYAMLARSDRMRLPAVLGACALSGPVVIGLASMVMVALDSF